MRVGIIGCGLVGQKRARALGSHQLAMVADEISERAESLAGRHSGCRVAGWREVAGDPAVDAVMVATTHDALSTVALACVESGKHVLLEKPAARNPGELAGLIAAADNAGVKVRVGFNHRYHPAMQKAKEMVAAGKIGELMYLRGRYGHGGRLGYEKEWRADKERSGGGELLDQGIHLIDLARWYLGEFTSAQGQVSTCFWDMPVEDNAFVCLRTAAGKTAWLHASWTEWKNLFSLEIFGRDGKLQIDGLGGSYGQEELRYYRMLPQMGPPEESLFQFTGDDGSWQMELDEFVKDIEEDRVVEPGLHDAMEALKLVQRVYEVASKKC